MSLSPPQLGELAQNKRKAAAMKDLDFTAKKVKKLQDDLDKARAAAATAVDLEAQLEKAKAAAEDSEVLTSAAAAKGNKKAKEKKDKQEEVSVMAPRCHGSAIAGLGFGVQAC